MLTALDQLAAGGFNLRDGGVELGRIGQTEAEVRHASVHTRET